MNLLNKLLSLFLVLLLLLSLCAPAALAAADDTVIYIRTVEDLTALARQCSLDSWSRGKTVRLLSDLDLTGTNFTPIPTFGGTFDGQCHTISGLALESSGSVQGLFRYVQESGTVTDLTVEGTVSAADFIGGIAGENRGVIYGCTFRGTVNGAASVGGIAGINRENGQITSCRFEGALTGQHYAGGIAGRNAGSIVLCTNGGDINVTEVKSAPELGDIDLEHLNSTENTPVCTDVGGIAGFSSGVIQSCLNTGNVGYPHVGYNIGGITGRQTGYLDGCTNEGLILGRKDVGGIAGQMEPQLILKYDQTALELLWGELDTLETMVNDLLSAGNDTVHSISGQMDQLSSSAADVKDAVGQLAADAAAWADGGLEQINDLSARAAWVLDRMAPIVDLAPQVIDRMETVAARLTLGLEQTAGAAVLGADAAESLSAAATNLQATALFTRSCLNHITTAIDHLKNSLGDPEVLAQALTDLFDGLSDMGTAFTQSAEALGRVGEILDTLLLWFSGEVSGQLEPHITAISTAVEEILAVLETTDDPSQLGPALSEIISRLEGSIASMQELIARLQEALDSSDLPEESLEAIESELAAIEGCIQDISDAWRQITDALKQLETNPRPELLADAVNELESALSSMEVALFALSAAMGDLSDAMEQLTAAGDKLADALETFALAGDALTEASTLLEQMAEEAALIVAELADMKTIQFDSPVDSLSPSGTALNDAADGFFRSADALNAVLPAGADDLTGQVQDIVGQIGVITGLLQQAAGEQLDVEAGDLLEDVSDQAADASRSTGKLSGCTNLGIVEGDVNVAGIVGSMSIEYDFDPEDDLTVSGERTLSVRYLARAVVHGCVNRGAVTAKKNQVGGIVGLMDLGSVISCQGYGSVTSTGGSYAGGIAGTSYGAIRDCWAMATLSGGDCIGGIAGLGTIITDCRTLIDLTGGSICVGAISGRAAENAQLSGNLFVHHELAGIDGVSYAGWAEPVTYDGLCALEGIPVDFTHFQLTFTADGKVVDTIDFRYGDSLEALPAIPEKAAHTAKWPELDYSFLTFSRTLEAEYTPYSTALSDGQPLPQYLVSGSFSKQATVTLTPYLDGHTITVADPAGPVTAFTLHWRLPDKGSYDLLVWNGAAWESWDHTVDGSYLLLECADSSVTFRLAEQSEFPVWILIVAVVLVIVIAAVIILMAAKRKKKVAK